MNGRNLILTKPTPVAEHPVPRHRWARVLIAGGTISWLLVISVGLWILWGYENTAGKAAQPPPQWPADSRIQPARDHATLVMLAHPHCPCTRATIGELASIMAHSQGRLTAYVLFLKPEGFSEDWEKTDLWRSAASIPGVTAMIDYQGAEANRFHAATSGQTLLYDAAGRLLFSGGITGSRGHSGDNAGHTAIVSLVNSGAAELTETSVFGCPLFDPNSECPIPKDDKHIH
ncbi:MAG TPA: hypothetical protein VK475_10735 [Pyrinomonadaceae bacterium]|nr:hypothetical protein [Pyrinomonadaceae bacterium]